MAAMIWDEQSQAFIEPTNVPMRYDHESGARVETTGKSWNTDAQAWVEKWSPMASMPQSISSASTPGGSTGSATSDIIDVSKFRTLSGKWTVGWFENSQNYPNFQRGYGEIIADNVVVLNTGNCYMSNQSEQNGSSHYKYGTFSIDISSYSSLRVRVTATESYSNWYHYFYISDLVWTR